MAKEKNSLNTIYVSERLQECLRPISHCAMTTVIAPMGYGKTTAVNWYLEKQMRTEKTVLIPHQYLFQQSAGILEKRANRVFLCRTGLFKWL